MAYEALYRQWRPANFESLVGQPVIVKTLTAALTQGRIAHAYLFAGPRGTGKTSTARILAKALNCQAGDGPTASPCGVCDSCRQIAAGSSLDVLEIDAASARGIDEMKELREQLAFAPVNSRYKIYIIDEVHMLTTEAFNALLKSLEEPPERVVFILATTDPQKVLPTIHSRCQRFDFQRVSTDEIAAHLAKIAAASGFAAEKEALRLIAIQAEGGLRDAISLLDQCGVVNREITVENLRAVLGVVGREGTRELVTCVGKSDVEGCLRQLGRLLEQGKAPEQILLEVAAYLRALFLYRTAPAYEEIYLVDSKEHLAALDPLFTPARLMASQERLHSGLQELRQSMRRRMSAELCLMDLCRQSGSTLAALTARVEELEKKLAALQASGPRGTAEACGTKREPPATEAATAVPAPTLPQQKQKRAANSIDNLSETSKNLQPEASSSPLPKEEERPLAESSSLRQTGEDGGLAAGRAYYRQLLDLAAAEGKKMLASCAAGGSVIAFDGEVLQVSFKNAFLIGTMQSPDFRRYITDALLRLSGRPLQLECVAATVKAEKKRPVVSQPKAAPSQAAADLSSKEEELPETLRKGLAALGGRVEKMC